jgi:mannose-1-phosphate guanylyltransferase
MIYPVILAGGWGERLWPMSTPSRPKQVLTLGADRSLVGRTLDRVAAAAVPERALVMTSAQIGGTIPAELPGVPVERIIAEPMRKNTAPAIALAAHLLLLEDEDAVMVVLPADHIIGDDDDFRRTIQLAADAANGQRALVTLGITPSRPDTEYGYIEAGDRVGDGVFRVRRFTEKPDASTAAGFLDTGGYYWNSGMFIWRADAFLEEVAEHLPDVASALARVTVTPGAPGFAEQMNAFYEETPSISVDYGIMERTERALVVPADFGWDDVGAWSALGRVWAPDENGNSSQGEVVLLDSNDCIAYAEGGVVAAVGVEGLVVVHTPEATVVCPRERAREVRDLLAEVRRLALEKQ